MVQDISKYPSYNPSFVVEAAPGSTPTHAQIVVEPLDQGYGHTLGNALRRVLLTSLPGTALTMFRLPNADHQYTAIEGVTEDVLELGLNLKLVRVRSSREGAGVLRLSATGPKTVTAGDIEAEAGFEIVNPEQYLATVAEGASLELELRAESGMGYVPAEEKSGTAIGDIMLDALFSPIIKVSYRVEATRVGSRTDFDRLILEVETDGTIAPLEAVQQAAHILKRQFDQVLNPTVEQEETPVESISPEEAEVLRLTVEELDLPTRIANALRKGGFKTVGDLMGVPKETIAKVKNLGEKSVSVIDEAIQKKGVQLGD